MWVTKCWIVNERRIGKHTQECDLRSFSADASSDCPISCGSVNGNLACSSSPGERPSQKKFRTHSKLASDIELLVVNAPLVPVLNALPSVKASRCW
jgi:hypothetical protein